MFETVHTGTLEVQIQRKSDIINVRVTERMYEIRLQVVTGDAFKIPGVNVCAFAVRLLSDHLRQMLIPGVNRAKVERNVIVCK